MKLFYLILAFILSCDVDNKKASTDNNFVNNVNKDTLFSNIKIFSDFGIKSAGSIGNTNTRNWIIKKITNYGYNYSLHDFSVSDKTGYNIIIDIPGDINDKKFTVLCGHYDSVIRGPGANDNGSGVAVLLEILRLLKDENFSQNLRFIFFDAEENGLIGSTKYADKMIENNETIEFLFNLDMVGGHKDMNHSKIVCEEDQNGANASDSLSHDYNLRLVESFKKYTTLTTVIDEAYGTDYVPFEKKGFTIIGLYEYKGQESNPTYHKATDTYDNIHKSFTYEVAKGAIGFLVNELNK